MKKSVSLLLIALAASPAFAETKRSHHSSAGSSSSGLPPKWGGLIQPAPLTDIPTGLVTSEMSGKDLEFLSSAIEKGREQVWLCKAAADKASNEQIREAGKVLVSTQEQENTYLTRLAAKKGLTIAEVPQSPGQKKLASELGSLGGSGFDGAVMNQIVTGAQAAIGSYENASGSGDTEIKTIAERLLPVAKDKLLLAYRITGRNPDGSPRPAFRTQSSLPSVAPAPPPIAAPASGEVKLAPAPAATKIALPVATATPSATPAVKAASAPASASPAPATPAPKAGGGAPTAVSTTPAILKMTPPPKPDGPKPIPSPALAPLSAPATPAATPAAATPVAKAAK